MKSFLILLWDYFSSEIKRTFVALVIPVLAAVTVSLCFCLLPKEAISSLYSSILTVLGVLIGFSISFHAIILSADSEEFKMAKEYYGDDPDKKSVLSLFEIEVANNIFVIMIQACLILFNLLIPFVWRDYQAKPALLSINVFGVVYVIELLLRSILDSYLIITTKKK